MRRLWRRLEGDAHRRRPRRAAYTIALIAPFAATATAFVVHYVFGAYLPFLFGIGAVLVATSVGGFGPGLVATALNLALALATHGTPSNPLIGDFTFTSCVVAIFEISLCVIGGKAQRVRRESAEQTRQLRQRDTHLQSIFEAMPAAMLVVEEDGCVHAANAAAERLFGLTQAALHERRLEELITFNAPAGTAIEAMLRDAEGAGGDDPIAGLRPDGAPLLLRLAHAETFNSGGSWFYTLFARDVTDEAARARRMQELQDELVHMARLTALGEMGAAMAHELNQPLAAATNYLGAARRLADRLADAKAQSVVRTVDAATEQVLRAGAVLKRLRSFVSRMPPEHREIDIRDVVAETALFARPFVREARVDLQVGRIVDVGAVMADRVHVQQVILNLVRNAAEAMDGEELRVVTITVRTDPAVGADVVVCVRDTGPGVSPEIADRLFEPFNTSKADGMGVGLAICRTIVESHGGRIWYERPPSGPGAQFCFSLPAASRTEAPADAIRAA